MTRLTQSSISLGCTFARSILLSLFCFAAYICPTSEANADDQDYFALGVSEAKDGQHRSAIESFSNALKKPGLDNLPQIKAVVLVELAKSHLVLEEYREVVDETEKAISLGYDEGDVHYFRGTALAYLGKNQAALDSLTKAISRDSKNSMAYAHRGVVLVREGNLEIALNDFVKSLELSNQNVVSLYNISVVYIGLNKPKMAINHLNELLQLQPKFRDAYALRARAFRMVGDRESALQDDEHARSLKSY